MTYTSITLCAFMEYKGTALLYVTLLSFGRQLTSKALHLFRRAASEVGTVLFPIHFFGGGGGRDLQETWGKSVVLSSYGTDTNIRDIRDTWGITFTFPFLQLIFKTAVLRGQYQKENYCLESCKLFCGRQCSRWPLML
jgi:hypothetical protein